MLSDVADKNPSEPLISAKPGFSSTDFCSAYILSFFLSKDYVILFSSSSLLALAEPFGQLIVKLLYYLGTKLTNTTFRIELFDSPDQLTMYRFSYHHVNIKTFFPHPIDLRELLATLNPNPSLHLCNINITNISDQLIELAKVLNYSSQFIKAESVKRKRLTRLALTRSRGQSPTLGTFPYYLIGQKLFNMCRDIGA